jgi:hypothetical protein
MTISRVGVETFGGLQHEWSVVLSPRNRRALIIKGGVSITVFQTWEFGFVEPSFLVMADVKTPATLEIVSLFSEFLADAAIIMDRWNNFEGELRDRVEWPVEEWTSV